MTALKKVSNVSSQKYVKNEMKYLYCIKPFLNKSNKGHAREVETATVWRTTATETGPQFCVYLGFFFWHRKQTPWLSSPVLRGTEVGFLQPNMSSISPPMLFSSSPRPPPPQVLRVSSLYAAEPSFSDSMAASAPKWAQKTITLPPHHRGCHLITPKVSSSFRIEVF